MDWMVLLTGAPQTSDWGYGAALLKMVLALALVCLVAFLVLRYGLQRLVAPRTRAGGIRLVDRCTLVGSKSLWVVEVGRRYFLVGTSESGVSKLAELDSYDVNSNLRQPGRPGAFEALVRRRVGRDEPRGQDQD